MNNDIAYLTEVLARARREVAKVIIGQESVTDRALIAIFTNQHA
ncbi:MAG TPA: magnesium chelatase, partial [Candidatus Hydrogenedentes bacterium]|nr:magnesium chelatase [Candidatus Hydrogenedentota bacterium]